MTSFGKWKQWLLAVAIVGMVLFPACGGNDQDDSLTLRFRFKDAREISVGDRVVGDGINVGKVVAPPKSTEPGRVLVKVEIDNIGSRKKRYLTRELSAEIKKDSLVAGESYVNLIFPKDPGETVSDGTVLQGKDVGQEVAPGVTVPTATGQQVMEVMMSAFGVSEPGETGLLIFYINWGFIAVLALVLFAMMIDLLIRLPQGKNRERSAPKILRSVWHLFVICLLLKLVLFAMQALALYGLIPISDSRWIITPESIQQLVSRQAGFWVFAFILIGFRFKMQLLMRGVR